MRDEDDERGVARPNDELRAAVLEALDIADRAGVAVSWVQAQAHNGRAVDVHLQGRDGDSGAMSRTDALRIALRAGSRSDVGVTGPLGGGDKFVTLDVRMRSGVKLAVYCQPTADELEAAVAAAVLQS